MYRKTVLENGVRVVTEKMPGVRSLTIGVLIDAGSKDEPVEINGVAHCIEHMLFKGTTLRDAASLARMIDLAGGQLGAFTARDYTCLYAAVLDDYRTFALDIFGDILLHSRFDEDSLRREKAAISQELEAGEEHPAKLTQEILKQTAWSGHPLGHNIYGRRESVARLTRPALLEFFQKHYRGERIIVSAAGNLEHDDFVTQVNDALWALPGSVAAVPAGRTPRFQAKVELRQRDSSQVYFALGAPAPLYTSPDRYSVFVLNALLGAGMSSRLYQQVRDERGWVYEIGSNYHPYRDGGMLVVEGFTTLENLLPVVETVVEQLINLLSEPVSDEELWRAKEYLRGEILISAEASNSRMSQLATQEFYFGRFLPLEELVEGVRQVQAHDVQALADKMFQPGGLALAALGPLKEPQGLQNQLEELLGI
jgi:predicted Zn-dependent peptidase